MALNKIVILVFLVWPATVWWCSVMSIRGLGYANTFINNIYYSHYLLFNRPYVIKPILQTVLRNPCFALNSNKVTSLVFMPILTINPSTPQLPRLQKFNSTKCQEGRWECHLKYIGQNCFSYFLRMQQTIKGFS